MPNLFLFIIRLSSALISLFIISILFYSTLYYYYIPKYSLTKPIYFQHDVACNRQHFVSEISVLGHDNHRADTSANCRFAHYDIPVASDRFFTTHQPYDFSLHFQLPDSEVNRNIGMFMIRIRLFDQSNLLLYDSSRPALLPYQSGLIRTAKLIVFIPLYVLGVWQESHSLRVALIDSTLDPSVATTIDYASISRIRLEVQTYKPIEITPGHCELRIKAKLAGFVYWMYFWPVTTAIVITITTYLTLLAFYSFLQIVKFLAQLKPPKQLAQYEQLELDE